MNISDYLIHSHFIRKNGIFLGFHTNLTTKQYRCLSKLAIMVVSILLDVAFIQV